MIYSLEKPQPMTFMLLSISLAFAIIGLATNYKTPITVTALWCLLGVSLLFFVLGFALSMGSKNNAYVPWGSGAIFLDAIVFAITLSTTASTAAASGLIGTLLVISFFLLCLYIVTFFQKIRL